MPRKITRRPSSNRADLDQRSAIEHDLWLSHVPPQQRLSHGIDLVVVRAVGEGGALLDDF
jgi:hypothetical protein